MNKTIKRNSFHRKQRGDFLVSLTVALIIVALMVMSAMGWFKTNSSKVDVGEAKNLVNAIGGGLRSNFGANNEYPSLTTAAAVQSGVIPASLRIAGTNTANNPYGGAITATPVNCTGTSDCASQSWANVPTSACMELVLGTMSGARRITVGGSVVKPLDAKINTATLGTACDAAAPVTIVWDHGRTGS
ncbi:type 4 pilus major pilin [Pseudoduganella sp. R-34]|jgi:hypothetical protein|uniref:type 4 pilus major pilin n=1 Tax=Pseudoduganella sp. R-34 TaxID=3404062 RepID=UPI003CECC205